MILTKADIADFEKAYEHYGDLEEVDAAERSVRWFYRWLSNHPQVLVAAGYQEFVGAHTRPLYRRIVRTAGLISGMRPAFRTFEGSWLLPSSVSLVPSRSWDGYSLDALRALARQDFDDEYLFDNAIDDCVVEMPSFESIRARAEKVIDNPLVDASVFVSPTLWTPDQQARQKDLLLSCSLELIRAIQSETCDLKALKWSELEIIVAELLRKQGMEIALAERRPQGGRDIVARWEMVPGLEPLTIAVEVKHQSVVDRPEIQKAIYQNSHFPGLLFVTSGRFTAGVLREAQKPENRLRLFLRDGEAIRHLLASYPLGKESTKLSKGRGSIK